MSVFRRFPPAGFMFVILMLLMTTVPLTAQENPVPVESSFKVADGWTLEERCVKAATPPPADWSYDGTIFMYEYQRGAKALRSDVPQPYFIAFDGQTGGGNYNVAGQVSPDGKWYAVPAGRDYYADYSSIIQTLDRTYIVHDINIFSTGPNSKLMYHVPWNAAVSGTEYAVYPVVWKNNSTIIYPEYSPFLDVTDWYQLNPFNGAKALYKQGGKYRDISPDGSVGVSYANQHWVLQEIATGKIIIDEFPDSAKLRWLSDSSGYLLTEKSEKTETSHVITHLNHYDREGNLLGALGEFEGTDGITTWLPDRLTGRYLALTLYNALPSLYIFDLEERLVIDTCLNNVKQYSQGFYWSPVTNQLLVEEQTQNGKDVFHIIDWQTSEDYIIGEVSSWSMILGWYPNEKTPPDTATP